MYTFYLNLNSLYPYKGCGKTELAHFSYHPTSPPVPLRRNKSLKSASNTVPECVTVDRLSFCLPKLTIRTLLIQHSALLIQHSAYQNSMNLYPPTKGILRETCKSQNINPIYLTLSSTFSIIQIITNACQVCFSA